MTIQARLGDQHANLMLISHPSHLSTQSTREHKDVGAGKRNVVRN
jgi:hypothetical protein